MNRPARSAQNSSDLIFGLLALIFLCGLSFVSPAFSGILAFWLAFYFFSSGMHILGGQSSGSRMTRPVIASAVNAPVVNTPTLADKMASINIPKDLKCPSCGAAIHPTDKKCNYCGSSLVPLIDLPQPANFGDVQVGQSVQVKHPKQGELTLTVHRRLYYGELWQEHGGANVPWTTTGTYFVGLTLDRDLFLLNWQSRFYLLESHSPLTDMDINRDFAPYAHQFAMSNQTGDVRFRYANENWKMIDIGKFRIEYCEGEGAQISPGSVGRFIHATNGNDVLVVEDYQSGGSGGLDTLWKGLIFQQSDIKT
ncbi:MAG TPA: zinc ribbon domain-containing protein [Anaerolineales bacterium]|nr:zinc ribbon domain-containing protein [Anaerolineales bacterium]